MEYHFELKLNVKAFKLLYIKMLKASILKLFASSYYNLILSLSSMVGYEACGVTSLPVLLLPTQLLISLLSRGCLRAICNWQSP